MVGVAFFCCTPVLSVGDRLFVYYMISFDKNKKLDLQAQSALYPGPGTNWAGLEFKNLKIPRHEYVTYQILKTPPVECGESGFSHVGRNFLSFTAFLSNEDFFVSFIVFVEIRD